jgi:two-component system phosphate regulon sensor histidine kinase PhoR
MKWWGVKQQLFVLCVVLGLVCAGSSYILLRNQLKASLLRHATVQMKTHLNHVLHMLDRCGVVCGDAIKLQAYVYEISQLGNYRVTVVAQDGRVLADSAVRDNQANILGNHSQRPEVLEAREGKTGFAVRWSESVHKQMLYVAKGFDAGKHRDAVVRIALPFEGVDSVLGSFSSLVWLSLLAVLGVVLLVSYAVACGVASKAQKLTASAQSMASGRLNERIKVHGRDEFAELGDALNQLASGFEKALHSLKNERDVMECVLQNMREGVLLTDEEQRIVLGNAALCDMFMFPKVYVGKHVYELIEHPGLMSFLRRAEQQGHAGALEIEVEKNGVSQRWMVYGTRLQSNLGGMLAVFVDVTELRRLESLRKDFVANASHELRTPVAIVRSAAETLPRALSSNVKMTEQLVDVIGRNAERLHALVEDLLDLSRIESKGFVVFEEDVDVGVVVQHVLGLFSEKIKNRDITASFDVDEDVPVLYTDKSAVEQVLSNLLDNAIKYSGPKTSVDIRVKKEGSMVRVCVKDTGPGIAAEHIPRLFERFYRVDKGRSRELGGTGLGLSIVKHWVDVLGGNVQVESVVGRGSRFSFSLPV